MLLCSNFTFPFKNGKLKQVCPSKLKLLLLFQFQTQENVYFLNKQQQGVFQSLLCMYGCIHVLVCIHVYLQCVCMHDHAHMYVHACIYVYMCVCMCVFDVYIVYVCICILSFMYVCMCMYACYTWVILYIQMWVQIPTCVLFICAIRRHHPFCFLSLHFSPLGQGQTAQNLMLLGTGE